MRKRHLTPIVLALSITAIVSVMCTDSVGRFTFVNEISVRQLIVETPQDWESHTMDVTNQLMAVSIYDGHPENTVTLVPDSEYVAEGMLTRVWVLPEIDRRTHWIECSYYQTSVALIRPLDPEITTCKVTYDPNVTVGGHARITDIYYE